MPSNVKYYILSLPLYHSKKNYSSLVFIGIFSQQGWTATTRHGVTKSEDKDEMEYCLKSMISWLFGSIVKQKTLKKLVNRRKTEKTIYIQNK